ncbi:alpha/beta fold hydrolase [Flavobacterium arcticum]|uniref:Alpha/beta fold hydrolase n=1 Tax=Flavobacterium arcticum TaxID=1784713 RepID=A0A345HDF4_9FLAO|nr:alpha/beta fold hydrolase [Flavobacterium arcticum]AXG74614.1 alpha/beta fold hydrolase [Flavobacterium arcticum]KAF2512264.1 alpha/beta fold hydrolase [Flavobacterium arcticum]
MQQNLSLYHLVREPKIKKDKNPLILLLHGYGSNEEDLFSFAAQLPDEYFIVSARAPYALPPHGNAWYAINFDADMNKFSDNEQAIQSRDLIVKFIDELIATYPMDKDNVTLVGFSQGSILSYAVALTYPEKINRVAALSGYVNEDIIGENANKENINKLKFFISHGSVDQVIPVEWARKAPEFVKNLGIETEYHEYPVGHGVAPQNFYDMLAWLNK